MKTLFLLFTAFLSANFFGQNTEEIKLNVNISDPNQATKSLTLIDLRENKKVGSLKKGNTEYEVVFQKEEKQAISDWFSKYNTARGKDNLHLVWKKLNITQEETQNKLEISAGVFLKKADKYHYITKVDTVLFDDGKSNALVRAIPALLGNTIKKSYKIVPWKEELTETQLLDYENVMKQNMAAFSENTLKDGVYKNYYSFFRQTPETGNYTLVKDEKGQVTRAVDENKNRIPARQIYIYVENGKAYRRTLVGFVEMEKDEKGYYIMSNHASLFPIQGGTNFGISFGLIGAIIDAAETSSARKKGQAKEKSKYYIDHLTGYYILEQK